MHTRNRIAAFALAPLAVAALARAEEGPPPAPESRGDGAVVARAEVPPAAPEAPRPEAEIAGKLESLERQTAEARSALEALWRVKLSGYVQGRFQLADNSADGLDARGNPRVKDQFSIRRGRFKAAYFASTLGLVLQIDATPKGVALKDAEAHLIEPWTGQKLALVMGQTKWPFGHEVVSSSSEREMPERTRVIRSFFAGERDLGAKVVGKVGALHFAAGVFNGNGTENRAFVAVDNDRMKDWIGRVGFDLGWLSGGVSGWWGKTVRSQTYDDAGGVDQREAVFDRWRLGADVQARLALLSFGETGLKAEAVRGRTFFKDGAEVFGAPAFGWYAQLTQAFLGKNIVFARYDVFDPLLGTGAKVDSQDPSLPASTNSVATLGLGLIHQWSEMLRLTLAYEIPMTQVAGPARDPADNLLTFQVQAKL